MTTSDDSIGVSVFHSLRATRLTADGNRYAGIDPVNPYKLSVTVTPSLNDAA